MPKQAHLSLPDALRNQAISCRDLGSPFMGQLLNLLADRLRPGTPLTDRLFNWSGDISSNGHSVPLRLAGALHRLVLSGQNALLVATYPPNRADDETLWNAVSQALIRHDQTILSWLNSPPQTNEVRRAAALIAVGQLLADRFGLPMMVSELGASAGLNLNWNRFRLDVAGQSFGAPGATVVLTPDWTGNLPPAAAVNIIDKRGVDLLPVDISNTSDRLRLKSYLWPDQPARMTLTENAIALPGVPVDQGDAIDWLKTRLPGQSDDTLHLIYTTIAWQYFPTDTQIAGRNLMELAGRKASKTNPLAWFSMEQDGKKSGAALTLRLWPGDQTTHMGRADFHGRWIDWRV